MAQSPASRLVPSWSNMSAMASARIVYSTYIWLFIVPIAARALTGTGAVVSVPVGSESIPIHLALPFTWQLFYASAVLFTLGNLTFFFGAPRIVKDHANAKAFREAGKGWNQLRAYQRESGMSDERFLEIRDYLDGSKLDESRKYHAMKQPESRYYELFWSVYENSDSSRMILRSCCALLYGAGLVAIGLVFLENLLVVLEVSGVLPPRTAA
jgi:hypothetical protein